MENITIHELIQQLRASELVREKRIDENISSFNFSRNAFFKKEWNDMSIRARGLFVDTKAERIKARSYDKFFHINERPETDLLFIEKAWLYPIDVYIKENGYLGICSWNDDGTLFCASKSTTEGYFASNFEKLLTESLGDNYSMFWQYLHDEDLSAIFEVIDPDNDPHIIEYDCPKVILLDLVYNSMFNDGLYYDFTNKVYEVLTMDSVCFNLPCKKRVTQIWNAAELHNFYNKAINMEQYDNKYIEGFVFEDLNGQKVKLKTDYYNYWKTMRAMIPYISQGKVPPQLNKIDRVRHPETNDIVKYMNHMLPIYYEINNEYMDIITFRQAWLEHIGG